MTIRPKRPLVVMSMTRPRRSFGLPCKLVDRDAYDWLTDDYMAKVREGRAKGNVRCCPLSYIARGECHWHGRGGGIWPCT